MTQTTLTPPTHQVWLRETTRIPKLAASRPDVIPLEMAPVRSGKDMAVRGGTEGKEYGLVVIF